MTYVTVNLSALFSHREPWDCSNSIANLGPRAGELTWGCAMELAGEHEAWLVSPLSEALDAVRADAHETGAWDREEIEAWSDEECLAYLVQCLASDLRLLSSDEQDLEGCLATYQETDWDREPEYPRASLYFADDGETVMAQWYGGI